MANDLTVARESSLAPPVDEDIGLQVIERLAVGRSLEEIGAIPGFPNKEVFLIWLVQSPALAQAFAKSREISAYALEEEALTMLRELKGKVLTPAQVKTYDMLVQHLRWSAEKRNPAVFSKQSNVSVQIPVQINTSLDLGESRAGGGTSEFPNIYELKATAERVVDLPPVKPELPTRSKVEKADTPEEIAIKKRTRAAAAKRYRDKQKLKAVQLP